MPNQVTTAGVPVTFTVPATDVDTGALQFIAVGPTRDAQGNFIGIQGGNPVTNATVTVNGKEISRSRGGTTTLLASFVTTNLVFTLAHGIFVAAFVFGLLEVPPSEPSVRQGLLGVTPVA